MPRAAQDKFSLLRTLEPIGKGPDSVGYGPKKFRLWNCPQQDANIPLSLIIREKRGFARLPMRCPSGRAAAVAAGCGMDAIETSSSGISGE
jgi:hypothetical protein